MLPSSRNDFVEFWTEFWEGNFRKNGERRFREHYDDIRRMVPPENLREYNVRSMFARRLFCLIAPTHYFVDQERLDAALRFPRCSGASDAQRERWQQLRCTLPQKKQDTDTECFIKDSRHWWRSDSCVVVYRSIGCRNQEHSIDGQWDC